MSVVDSASAASLSSQPPELRSRFFRPRTLVSFVVGAAILVFALSRLQVDVAETERVIAGANWALIVLALLVYYLAFPFRGIRWQGMLENAGFRREDLPSVAGLAEIIYLSWFANSVVPAKLGDVYRAYLLRERSDAKVSFSKAGGTIVAERLIDLIVLIVLLGSTGLASFRGRVPAEIQTVLEVGAALVVIALTALLALRLLGGTISSLIPSRFERIYEHFLTGAVESFGGYPRLVSFTVLSWAAECGRFFLVTQALGVQLSAAPLSEVLLVVFVALGAAFLTAPPGTPAGLGYVEASVVGALTLFGVNQSVALSVALLDRSISVGSLIVGGLIVYLLGHRRTAKGL
jgi:uncharacterized protein (TIRG00374 family)